MDIIVEKIRGGVMEDRALKNCQLGDVVEAHRLYGTYVVLGGATAIDDAPKSVGENNHVGVLHIMHENGQSAPLRLAELTPDTTCTLVGRLRKLQWSGL